jgi:hypothetical protein
MQLFHDTSGIDSQNNKPTTFNAPARPYTALTEQNKTLGPLRTSQRNPPSYMQPDPSNVSPNALPQDPPRDNSTSPHHGIHLDQLASSLPHPEGRGGPKSGSVRQDTSLRAPPVGRFPSPEETPRLSPISPSPRNRIEEYENALSPAPKKRPEGPLFEVIKKERKGGDKSSPISKLPNGMAVLDAFGFKYGF